MHRIVDDAGLTYKAVHYDHGNGLAVADIDGDGLTDIYFVNQAGPSELWKNLGSGRFQNVTSDAGVAVPGRIAVAASFADVDNDGDQDLFVTTVRGGNLLFENDGRGRFRDVTKESAVGLSAHSSGSVFFDYDNDGRLDLFVTDMHSDMFESVGPELESRKATPPAESVLMGPVDSFVMGNALYRNLGGGTFNEVSDAMGVENYWPWGPSIGDVNADGWDDIFIASSMNFPFRYGINSLLLNNKGQTFLTAEFMLGVEPRSHRVYAVVSTQLRAAATRSPKHHASDVREPFRPGHGHGACRKPCSRAVQSRH